MNIYWLKRFRKRFEIKTDGNMYVCYDKKEKQYLTGEPCGFNWAINMAIQRMLSLTELTMFLKKIKKRSRMKRFKTFKQVINK